MTNGLITGFHRSGTTLICYLLNKLPNIIALDEPLDVSIFKSASPGQVHSSLDHFFNEQRKLILTKGVAVSKAQSRVVPCNQLSDEWTDPDNRRSVVDGRLISISNVRGSEFSIYIKHPAVFTAMLPVLEIHYPCFISIRNPLSIILSWRATSFPVSRGRAPAAEMINSDLRYRLDQEDDILARQLILIDFFFSQYARRRSAQIIRYEDIINTRGRALSVIDNRAEQLDEPLNSRNSIHIKRDTHTVIIAERLLNQENACWQFYSHSEIAMLAQL